ncbi:MAG TPA: SIMPL domain-containing protein [Candidatus Magasanikbacteria bacterium]|nr:SIMPL domain-containing protein [Candidatus Magasanikbacteria bacterium]
MPVKKKVSEEWVDSPTTKVGKKSTYQTDDCGCGSSCDCVGGCDCGDGGVCGCGDGCDCGSGGGCGCSAGCGQSETRPYGRTILLVLLGILMVYLIIFVGSLIRNNLQKFYFIGRADRAERTITVQGMGKVTAKPDVAVTTMGMVASAKTVAEAQAKNTETMNKLILRLKELGVDSKDIQTTNYNIYPQYDYTPERGQTLRGYEVSQSVTVKVRDLDKANDVLGLAGEVGANNVSGLQFIIDDADKFKEEARGLALEKVWSKADALTKELGVSVVGVVSYDEYDGGTSYPMYAKSDMAVGMGGGMAAPTIESGSTDVVVNANVTFEIR